MPGDDSAALKENPQTRDIPLVVLGADGAPDHVVPLAAAAAAYLPTPLDVRHFVATVTTILTDGRRKSIDDQAA